jgi:uncharacterized membrane protein
MGWTSSGQRHPEERRARSRISLSAEGEELIRSYGVDYVVIGPDERADLAADEAAYEARFPVVVATALWRVYDVRSLSASDAP